MCKCKKFEHVNINDLHLHKIYRLYIRLLTVNTYERSMMLVVDNLLGMVITSYAVIYWDSS